MSGAGYWDASALLSVLVRDKHSPAASRQLRAKGVHLVSSLALAETSAVLARLARLGEISASRAQLAARSLLAEPWSALEVQPEREVVLELARRQPLRGADLWHLAAALTLRVELPELRFLSFDKELSRAAEQEGFPLA